MAAVLQLFIAVSMIVLVLEEVRYKNDQAMAEIVAVRSEKEALQIKVLSTEEQCRSLYDQVRLTEGLQKLMRNCAAPSRWWCNRSASGPWTDGQRRGPRRQQRAISHCRLFGIAA